MHETVTSLPNRQCPEQGRFFLNRKHMQSRTLSLELYIYIYQNFVLGGTYVYIYIQSRTLSLELCMYVYIYKYIDQDLVLGVTYAYIVQDFVLGVMYIHIESYIYIQTRTLSLELHMYVYIYIQSRTLSLELCIYIYTPCLWSYTNMRSLVP